MTSKSIDIKTANGTCDAYVSYPDAGGPFPAVLFYMDGIGFRDELKKMADRIAAQGYYVLLPNMFYAFGRGQVMTAAEVFNPDNRPKLFEMIGSNTPEKLKTDTKTFIDFLDAQKEVKPGTKIGTTGYCMGGAMVVRAAANFSDRVAAGGSFHGGALATDDAQSPHKLLGAVKAELYFAHADNDAFMTAEQIKTLEAALKAANVKAESETYPGAIHGFTMADLPVYNKDAAEKHWTKLLALFNRTLK